MRWPASAGALAFALLLGACGYHVSGHADLVPQTVHTVAVPPFANLTVRYRVTDQLAQAVSREFIARTRYRVVPDPAQADAILKGAVISYNSYPVIADQKTGRAAAIQIILTLQVSLTERATGKILYSQPTFQARQRYEISLDQATYFDESASGLARLSGDVARDLVSSILENF